MTAFRKTCCVLFALLALLPAMAQTSGENGSAPSANSPYTRYGYGLLTDPAVGNSQAMGGVAIGLRNRTGVNPANPASYTAIDSLTFLMDLGVGLQNGNFNDGKQRMNAKNGGLDYIAMQFRLHKRVAMSLGFLPFSTIGYSITDTKPVSDAGTTGLTAYRSYSGSGGLNQIYAGLGFKVHENLSVGVNASYLFGSITQSSQLSFSESSINTTYKVNYASIKDYKIDFGLQYTQPIGEKHCFTLGAVYSLGHAMNNEAYTDIQRVTEQNGSLVAESNERTIVENGFEYPHCYGAGITYQYAQQWTVGFDYTRQQWGQTSYFGQKGMLADRTKYAAGIEYVPNPTKRNYLSRVRYRIGGYFIPQPYVRVSEQFSAKEFGVSAGLGLPIFQQRSLLHIAFQYSKMKPSSLNSGLVEENYLRVHIGLTFNERWFAKWKVQ